MKKITACLIFLAPIFLAPMVLFSNSIAPIENKTALAGYKNTYLLLSDDEFHEGVNKIFANEPFFTNFTFSIPRAPKSIVTKMFNDLEYTAENGKLYAKSPYLINKKGDFYDVSVRNYADGEIYLVYINNQINRYIYYVQGTFDAFVTLKGKMIIDIQYRQVNRNIQFNVKSFLILDNPIYWNLFKKLQDSKEFSQRLNRLIDANIAYIVRVGQITVAGIYRDSRGKFKF